MESKVKRPIMEKATSSEYLTKRADTNRQYAKNDFALWVKALLEDISFSSVLDVCCGTGNQLVLYAAKPQVKRIVGVDLSKDSLKTAKERLKKIGAQCDMLFKAAKMEEMFDDTELNNEQFDLISCFYGLYYSQDAIKTLREMISHLKDKGEILIVGPYGKNNASFFEILRPHFKLPDLVARSSSTFMENEVYPELVTHCEVERTTFVNEIHYPTPQALIDYWRASTFYSPEHEEAVMQDVKDHFSKHGKFIIEKHIMAYKGRKAR